MRGWLVDVRLISSGAIATAPPPGDILPDGTLVMLEADMGRKAMQEVIDALRNELIGSRLRRGADLTKVIEASLKRALHSLLAAGYWDFNKTVDEMIAAGDTPVIIMMVGVNGTGKTTTTAKIANRLKNEGRTVVLAAADTFRAGAIDQLETHAERIGVRCVSSQRGGDSAAIARDAVESAKARGADVVIIDTAGRMTNKTNLMNELQKVHRVSQPHLVLFVGDALAGNDAVEQAMEFQRMLKFDGAVLCKLDTDAKGGAALSIAHATGRPIVLAGVGQEYDDLKQFDPDWLLGIQHACAGQVVLLDACMEVLVDAIDASRAAENSLLIVTSPRGFPLGEHHRVGACDHALFGELIQIPLFCRFPEGKSASVRERGLIQPASLYDTLADWFDVLPRPASHWASSFLLPSEESASFRDRGFSVATGYQAVRTPGWFLCTAREDEHKLFVKPDDRWEVNDVASRREDVVELLLEVLHDARGKRHGEPLGELAQVLVDGPE